ncbi:MAG: hypothetical protein HY904_10995 [Deltaproteobacteria bacterium]|nr:hypothetical protein [Deltaproteobacteria bacterium]
MTATLILLALLSVGALASRRGGGLALFNAAAAPVFLAAGFVLSPGVLGFLRPSMVQALSPALAVAVCWLALLLGLRAAPPTPGTRARCAALLAADVLLATTAGAVALAAGTGLLWTAGALPPVMDDAWHHAAPAALAFPWLAAALLSGTSRTAVEARLPALDERAHGPARFISRHDAVLAALSLLAAPLLAPGADPRSALAAMGDVLGLGLLLALAAVLFGARRERGGQAVLVIAACAVIAAGAGDRAAAPPAVSALIAGAVLAAVGVGTRVVAREGGAHLDRPVLVATTFLAGAVWTPGLAVIALGVALAAGRLVGKTLASRLLSASTGVPVRPGVLLPCSGLAVPFALALHLARPADEVTSLVFGAVIVAVLVTDTAGFAWDFGEWMRGAAARARTRPRMPAVTNGAAP